MLRTLAAMPLLVLLASGCAANTKPDAARDIAVAQQTRSAASPSNSAEPPRLLTYRDNGNNLMAGFGGPLTLNDAGCFALADGSTISVPDTWTVSPAGDGIVSPSGTEIRIGDEFKAGGGFGGPPRGDLTAEQRACPSDGPPYSNGGKYTSFAYLWGIAVTK